MQDIPFNNYEIIVADGMSDDGTRDVLKQLEEGVPHLRMIDNPHGIVSAGLNAAVQAARGQIIIRMDAHTEYAPDYIRQCIAALQETGADNIGGPWVPKGKTFTERAVAAVFQSPFAAGGARCHDPGYEGLVDTVYLGCWSREVFDRIGTFDEELVRSQDDEFNLRLTRFGGKIWQSPRIRSWYKPRGSLIALFQQYMQYGYWKVRVIQKHKIPASIRHLIPGGFVLLLIILPLASLWSSSAAWLSLGLVGMYAMCSIAFSLATAASHGWRLFPLLPAVFVCYHIGYGYGFLHGVWDFVILRRGPNHSFSKLSRASNPL
jgi:glycosyltransferase involved in cell wall biosynthesis